MTKLKIDKLVQIPEISIADNNRTIFDDQFNIPIYQRDFAWDKDEVKQLLKDISYFKSDSKYYLGSLIVEKINNVYNVIDGQQRLTALYILLSYLNVNLCKNLKMKPLTYSCRPDSNSYLTSLANNESNPFTFSNRTRKLEDCYDTIKNYFENEKNDIENFFNRLQQVVLFKIEVPKGTDLNRYFITMNTTSEQLEQHEILKAKLISYMPNDVERHLFAVIWEACQNMDNYMQRCFDTPKNRTKIFGSNENDKPQLTCENFSEIANDLYKNEATESDDTEGCTLEEIIDKHDVNNNPDKDDATTDNESEFKSIVDDFPHFILHVLNVFADYEKDNFNDYENIVPEKQKKLNNLCVIDNFEEYRKKYKLGDYEFAKHFIVSMLNCRYLFDNFIIKRKYSNTGSSSDKRIWSLECSKKFESYDSINTFDDKAVDKILMLQACLRVSITDQKEMFWITDLLKFLYNRMQNGSLQTSQKEVPFAKCFGEKIKKDFECKTESFINDKNNKDNALQKFIATGNFNLGVSTPHIVFNYLDYLLWKEIYLGYDLACSLDGLKADLEELKAQKNYTFNFEYRNSVEHWYPRHPKNNMDWTDNHSYDVDTFGNLCLLSKDDNSDFSNLTPKAKDDQFNETKIKTASLKLKLMSNLTKRKGWSYLVALEHQKQMLDLLKLACTTDNNSDTQKYC